ncbi:hypothetical protein E4U13_006183 [Claviceps humidiphila]|uniref:Flo11 n=1 Tax=Claviceps humidiphila TaxID=1294629 RepID=A0A9P7TN45_9HYPO|nr:hypothetical protein E4U13_006183 [Claviceps humidiphila]
MDSSPPVWSSGTISPSYGRPRTQSISSVPSTIGSGFVLPPLSVSPEFCFIAPSAASQIVTNDHDSHADAWYDQNGIEPPLEPATMSDPALRLVNGFLDQLLFNFLQIAKSTRLSSLRPAITEVLKPKLAKDAIDNAEEELKEYLGGANEDDFTHPHGEGTSSRDWDLELAWKRIRLRCMVYSSLGDMEEEDEDMYMEQEHLELGTNDQVSDVVSPAVSIFLTSVLEYMGELTVTVAGQAAYQRVRNKMERELREGSRDTSHPADRVVVADSDMERVALDRTLGRLWRGWKKRVRAPAHDAAGRPLSRRISSLLEQDYNTPETTPQTLMGLSKPATGDDVQEEKHDIEDPIAGAPVEAAEIPLPMTENDVAEIEVPGLVSYSDYEGTDSDEALQTRAQPPKRCKSVLLSPSHNADGISTGAARQTVLFPLKRWTSVPARPQSFYAGRIRKVSQPSASDLETKIAQVKARDEAGKMPEETVSEGAPQTFTQGGEADCENAADEFAVEKAEVVTPFRVSQSARSQDVFVSEGEDGCEDKDRCNLNHHSHSVSVSVSASARNSASISTRNRNDSNSSNTPPVKRSSMQTARLIDVSKPNSPRSLSGSSAHSRPASMDKPGQSRAAALSAVGLPAMSSLDAAADQDVQPTGQDAVLQTDARDAPSPADASTGAETWRLQQNASPADTDGTLTRQTTGVSDSGEQQTVPRVAAAPLLPAATSSPLPAASHSASTQGRKKGPPAQIITKTPSPSHTPTPTHTHTYEPPKRAKPSILPVIPDQVIEGGSLVGLPRNALSHAGKQSLKAESRQLLTVERSRTNRDTEQGSHTGSHHTGPSSVSSAGSRLKPVRTSEDGSSRSESVARNFEELIQSNQTITYTLTPETMRDVDSKSPVVTRLGGNRKTDDARTLNLHKPSLLGVQSGSGRLSSPHSPASISPRALESSLKSPAISKSSRSPTVPNSRGMTTPPKDYRASKESTLPDYSDFVSSTDERKVYIAPNLASPASPGMNFSHSRRDSTTSIINRSRYQPRDAAVDGKADNSDLIDFIRQGPPIASTNRIPRHVAPFRTTMDSDEMVAAIGGKAIDATLPDFRDSLCSTDPTDEPLSMHSSINSKSALLRNKGPSTVAGKSFGAPDDTTMAPTRKTRRIRDPYAIDLSDEDEDEAPPSEEPSQTSQTTHHNPPPRKSQTLPPLKREESLGEFLRNYDPPAIPPSSPPRIPKKKASAPSLMARFRSSTIDKNKDKDKDKDKARNKDSPPSRGPPGTSASTNTSSATGRGYVPITVNMPSHSNYDKFNLNPNTNPVEARAPSGGGTVRSRMRGTSLSSSSVGGRVPMKKFEPRDAVAGQSRTADLAAFLRDSAPPMGQGQGQEEGSGGGGIARRFGRKKKSMAV